MTNETKLIIDSSYGGNIYITIGKTYAISDDKLYILRKIADSEAVYTIGKSKLNDYMEPVMNEFIEMGVLKYEQVGMDSFRATPTTIGKDLLNRTKPAVG